MFTKILAVISAAIAAIAIYEIIVDGANYHIIAGVALFVMTACLIVIKLTSTAKKTLKHIQECTDENCEIRKKAEEAGLEVPSLNKDSISKYEDTTYRIREQKLFDKFGKTPEYGEYDFEFFANGLKKDIESGFIKTFTQPNIEELKVLIKDAQDYRDREDTRWYHAHVVLNKRDNSFVSRESKETQDEKSVSYQEYQNLVAELLQANLDETNNDSIGGLNVIYGVADIVN